VLERIDIFPWYRSESCYTKILEDPIHCWTFICLMASIVPHHVHRPAPHMRSRDLSRRRKPSPALSFARPPGIAADELPFCRGSLLTSFGLLVSCLLWPRLHRPPDMLCHVSVFVRRLLFSCIHSRSDSRILTLNSRLSSSVPRMHASIAFTRPT
jgi:hypothetical protein